MYETVVKCTLYLNPIMEENRWWRLINFVDNKRRPFSCGVCQRATIAVEIIARAAPLTGASREQDYVVVGTYISSM